MTRNELIKEIIRLKKGRVRSYRLVKKYFLFSDMIPKCLTKFGKDDDKFSYCMLNTFNNEYLYKGYLTLKYIIDKKFKKEVDSRNPFFNEMKDWLKRDRSVKYILDFTKYELTYEELYETTKEP